MHNQDSKLSLGGDNDENICPNMLPIHDNNQNLEQSFHPQLPYCVTNTHGDKMCKANFSKLVSAEEGLLQIWKPLRNLKHAPIVVSTCGDSSTNPRISTFGSVRKASTE